MSKEKNPMSVFTTSHALYPLESAQKVSKGKKKLFIGVPKETSYQEKRTPFTPKAVALLVNNGHELVIESGAGNFSKYSDHQYSEAGAQIVYSPEDVYKANLIIKIEPPKTEEINLMQQGQFLISALQLTNVCDTYVNALNKKKIASVGFELMENNEGEIPVMRAMSEIAGGTSVLIASELLSSDKGKGLMLGGITGVPPAKVLILGAGTVAEYAARAAIGLGADVKVFDNSIFHLRRLKHNIGMQLYTSTLDTGTLSEVLQDTDVVIGAIRSETGRSLCVVTEKMVENMPKGSVIVDVSIDQGGCFETSKVTNHDNPTFVEHDVIHYCVPNIASRVAQTASKALSNILTPVLMKIADAGGFEEMVFQDQGFMKGVYSYNGSLTNHQLAKRLGMQYKDLNLLMAARF